MSSSRCPTCGADLASPDDWCSACAARAARARAPAAPPMVLWDLQAELRRLTPRVLVTPVLMLLNVGVFVAMAVAGATPWNPTVETLLAWGADHGPTTFGGEWWRLLTAAFLHSGLPHLAFNMLCLYGAGLLSERLLGGPGFLLMYLASALAGSLASVAWSPGAVSVGASGAVFGIFGANFAATLRAAETIPPPILRSLQVGTAKLLALNFAVGFLAPNIDVAAHAGGLVCGFVAGLVLGHPLRPDAARRRPVRCLTAVVLLAPLLGLTAVIANHRASAVAHTATEMDRLVADEARVLAAYNDAAARNNKGTLDDPGFIAIFDRDVIGPWQEMTQRFDALRRTAKLDPEFARLYGAYLAVRGESFELTRKAVAERDGATMRRANELGRQGDRLLEELNRAPGGR